MTVPAALQTHYDSGTTCMANAVLIQRADGSLFGFTSCSKPLVLDLTPWDELPWILDGETAFVFDASQGLDVSQMVSTSGLEVDNGEVTTLDDGSIFTKEDILAGRWRNARWILFRYRWDIETPTIANDVEVRQQGTIGEFKIGTVYLTIEFRGLKQGLQQAVGEVSQPTCRARFGSMGLKMCNVDPAPYTHSLAVTTSAGDKRNFTSSGAGQAADYFGAGVLTWLTGLNAGLSLSISTFESGAFMLSLPTIFPIQIGDTFSAVAGCRKRRDEDCWQRYDNAVNFQGEPDRPTRDFVISGT